MRNKSQRIASEMGMRDGKDAYLTERICINPFDPMDEYPEHEAYEKAWKEGFEEEANILED